MEIIINEKGIFDQKDIKYANEKAMENLLLSIFGFADNIVHFVRKTKMEILPARLNKTIAIIDNKLASNQLELPESVANEFDRIYLIQPRNKKMQVLKSIDMNTLQMLVETVELPNQLEVGSYYYKGKLNRGPFILDFTERDFLAFEF